MGEDYDARLRTLHEELEAKQKELVALLRERSGETVDDVSFETPDGPATLRSLFGSKDDLILVHNMGAHCPYCTLWADGFNGMVDHLNDRAAFVVCSPDDVAKQQAFAKGRGWRFRMVSDPTKAFTKAMGYMAQHQGKDWAMPGFSSFRKQADGSIKRVGHRPFGPGDPFCGAWHFFDLLEDGVDGWQAKFSYEG